MIVVIKVDWGEETIQEILPELKKHKKLRLRTGLRRLLICR